MNLDDSLIAFAKLSTVVERGPVVRDFQDALGLSSPSVAVYRLKALEEAGYIERADKQRFARQAYRLTPKGKAELSKVAS
jgi:DNA-binding PadR family transcriptional regulator